MAQTWYDTSSTIVFLVHQREVEIVMITIFIIPKLGGLKPLMICRNSLSSERSQNHLNLNQDYRNTIITTPLNFLSIWDHPNPISPLSQYHYYNTVAENVKLKVKTIPTIQSPSTFSLPLPFLFEIFEHLVVEIDSVLISGDPLQHCLPWWEWRLHQECNLHLFTLENGFYPVLCTKKRERKI